MATWLFTNPTVAEAPFAWNPLLERFRMDRAETVQERSHNVWEILRYGSYTDELLYTGTGPGAPTVLLPNGLRYYRGGYEHIVSDQDRTDLIASGLVTAANFILIPDGAVTITSVNGYTGPVVVLAFTDVQANRQIIVRRAYITTGNITLPNVGAVWTPVAGVEIDVPASVGDYVEVNPSFMWQPNGSTFLDMGVIVGSTIRRFSSTNTGTSATSNEGDPSLYAAPGTYRTSGTTFGFTVTANDLDAGNVRFIMANFGAGSTSVLYASANYPYRWVTKNYGPVL